jgi:hypothetical protein
VTNLSVALLWAFMSLGPPDQPDFLEMVPAIVSATEQLTCQSTRFGADCGPFLVDVASFVAAGRQAAGADMDRIDVVRAIGHPLSDVPAKDAYACAPSEYPCMIRHEGVHLMLDSLHRTGVGWEAVVTLSWAAEASGQGQEGGYLKARLVLEREQGEWTTTAVKPLRGT